MLSKSDKLWISQEIDEKFDEKFKPFKDEVFTRLDAVMGELQAIREEQAAMFYRQRENTDQLEDHEHRLAKVELKLV